MGGMDIGWTGVWTGRRAKQTSEWEKKKHAEMNELLSQTAGDKKRQRGQKSKT